MQDYTNNPFVGQKVIQELKMATRKNLEYTPWKQPLQLVYQLENMEYMSYEIVERLKDKEPVIRQILKEQNDMDYLMDMHQEYYINNDKRENSIVYKLQNQHLSDIETQRIMANIPLCPGNIIELDTNEYQILQISPVMYLISVDWANTNQTIIKEYFNRWTPIIPYNSNLYVAMYSPNNTKLQENNNIHKKQFINVYNHRYILNYKYTQLVDSQQISQTKQPVPVYLSYNGQLYKLEKEKDEFTGNYKILSKLVKDFSLLPDMKDIKDYAIQLDNFIDPIINDLRNLKSKEQIKQYLNEHVLSLILREQLKEIVENYINPKDGGNNQDKTLYEYIKDYITEYKNSTQKLPQHTGLIDTQTDYFDTNQDYMFNIRQYSFTNSKGNVFIIYPPINNIVQNIYVYSYK